MLCGKGSAGLVKSIGETATPKKKSAWSFAPPTHQRMLKIKNNKKCDEF